MLTARRIGLGVAALGVAIAALVVGPKVFSSSYGPTTGNHVVNGYHLGPEERCVDVSGAGCDGMATLASTRLPAGAVVIATWYARPDPGCPPGTCAFAGLEIPADIIFDLADGSRVVVPMMCGPMSDSDPSGCTLQ